MKNRKLSSELFKLFMVIAVISLLACNKEEESTKPDVPKQTKGLFVLNEGLFNQNNSSLTYYDLNTASATTDYFAINNDRGLGDVANDIKVYGSKLYIVVTGSSQLEVLDSKTGKSIKQIALFDEEGSPRQPRKIAFHKNFAYVASFDGTVGRLDTATLEFNKFITLGKNPNGICVANDKIYVSNSGGLDFPNYDKTVSVVNTSTFEEIKRIEVKINPNSIQPDNNGDVYVLSSGNYNDVKPALQVINTSTDEVKHVFENLEVSDFSIGGDSAYVFSYDFVSKETKISVVDLKNETVVSESFITDGTTLNTPYGIAADSSTGDIYVTDAYDYTVTGDVYCFTKEGKLKFKFEAGLNPSNIVFIQ